MHRVHLVHAHVDLTEDVVNGLRDEPPVLVVPQVPRHGEGLSGTRLKGVGDGGSELDESTVLIVLQVPRLGEGLSNARPKGVGKGGGERVRGSAGDAHGDLT